MAGSVRVSVDGHESRRFSFKALRASIHRKMNFKLDRPWSRNRSHSDIGIYHRHLDTNFLTDLGGSEAMPELLARQMLTLSCPAVVAITITPPTGSSGHVADSLVSEPDVQDTVKYHRYATPDPALLHGSTGNFVGGGAGGGSGGGAKSAPATPLGNGGLGGGGTGGGGSECGSPGVLAVTSLTPPGTVVTTIVGSGPCSPANCPNHYHPPQTPTLSKSPSHHLFTKQDKESSKSLSSLSPGMTTQGRSPEPPSPKTHKHKKEKVKLPGSSKARQKKFHRHFPQVDADELVLNYYSCALVAEILLQGHLYITKNFFAFYSNVFGYVTKLLIPTVSVLKISKEKTARIIPNAVGITTEDDKHVFSSLLSRESTFNFMMTVWNAAMLPEPEVVIVPAIVSKEFPGEMDASECSIEEDDDSSSHSDNGSPALGLPQRRRVLPTADEVDLSTINEKETLILEPPKSLNLSKSLNASSKPLTRSGSIDKLRQCIKGMYVSLWQMPRHSQLMLASTLLLLLLFSSAGLLLYRIGMMQQRYSSGYQDNLAVLSKGDNVYNEILKWQAQLHAKSANEIHTFLRANLDQIAKIRQSLEALSLLIAPLEEEASTDQHANFGAKTINS